MSAVRRPFRLAPSRTASYLRTRSRWIAPRASRCYEGNPRCCLTMDENPNIGRRQMLGVLEQLANSKAEFFKALSQAK